MNTYLIYGNDYGLIKREIDKITNGIIDVVKYDLSASNVSEVIEEASCMSLFGDKKVVIGENALFLTGTNTSVNHDIDYLTSYVNAENHDNIVILTVVQDKLDERKKIVKLLKKNVTIIHKETIDEKDLPKFVIKEFLEKTLKTQLVEVGYNEILGHKLVFTGGTSARFSQHILKVFKNAVFTTNPLYSNVIGMYIRTENIWSELQKTLKESVGA